MAFRIGANIEEILRKKDDSKEMQSCVDQWIGVTQSWSPAMSSWEEELSKYSKAVKMSPEMERIVDATGFVVLEQTQKDKSARGFSNVEVTQYKK